MSVLFIAGFCTRWMAPGTANAVEMPTLQSAAHVKNFMVRSSPNLILPEEDRRPIVLASVLHPCSVTFQVATSASLPTFFEECRYEYRHGRRGACSTVLWPAPP